RLVRSIGRALDLQFSRIQFTPDLMPADVTGTNIIEKDDSGKSVQRFVAGPIFSNIILADEINRATPKTQSALLEAMQEHRVTAGGKTWVLSEPFFVLATQNPIEQDGTYTLPEAQMDRFMFKLIMTFPSPDELRDIVLITQETQEERAEKVVTAADLLAMRETAKEIPILDDVLMYAVRIVTATHPESGAVPETTKKNIRFGASPRAVQALVTAARIRAMLDGRYNVSYEDIEAFAAPVLRHRVKLTYDAIMEKRSADQIIKDLIAEVGIKRFAKPSAGADWNPFRKQ
nr:MoxR family ATPase [Clostridiales bacterium]